MCEIGKALGAEGYDRRGTGFLVDGDDGYQIVLKRPPCRAQSVGFGSSDVIHILFLTRRLCSEAFSPVVDVYLLLIAGILSIGSGASMGENGNILCLRNSSALVV